MQVTPVLTLAIAVLISVSCRPPTKKLHRFEVVVSAHTDTGRAIDDVTVALNGKDVGVTGPKGGLEIALSAFDGKVVKLRAMCPSKYRTRGGETNLTLRPFAISEANGGRNRLHVAVKCLPLSRRAAVLVQSVPNLPVILRGRPVARTDSLGFAHVVLASAPFSSFDLTIDTSANPRLRPRNPTTTFNLADADQVFVYDQELELLPLPTPKPKPRAKKKPKKRKRVKKDPGPIEIKSVDPNRRRRKR